MADRKRGRPRKKDLINSDDLIQATLPLEPESTSQSTYTPDPRWAPLKTTPVFETYWRFAAERQRIFFARLNGDDPPWTSDSILIQHKFTNAYRASDRVSQYLIRNVIYTWDTASPTELFFRILLFKFFNRIETWELLQAEFGIPKYAEFKFNQYDKLLCKAMNAGERIYSAAYIMPSGGNWLKTQRKHQMHLKLLEIMIQDELPQRLADCANMRQAFELIRSYPTIGDFLAYQYVTDLNYSPLLNFSEMQFVCAGPGAKDGIRKCFSDTAGLSEPEVIRLMADRQEEEFSQLGISFPTLWGRQLQLIDCQNLFCEVDKYSRVAHPEFSGLTGRSRIKQKFKQSLSPLKPWYPPKWGLNNKLPP